MLSLLNYFFRFVIEHCSRQYYHIGVERVKQVGKISIISFSYNQVVYFYRMCGFIVSPSGFCYDCHAFAINECKWRIEETVGRLLLRQSLN